MHNRTWFGSGFRNRFRSSSLGLTLVLMIATLLMLDVALSESMTPEQIEKGSIQVYGYKIIDTYPHDRGAFTEGLIYDQGFIYEGTGGHGRSSIRKSELDTGKVLKQHNLSMAYFGEGLTSWNGTLIELTWRSGIGFIYDQNSFARTGNFTYMHEGWGITHNSSILFMSDGTDVLYLLDPESMEEVGMIKVRADGVPVRNLNELEYINGLIYANVWGTDYIAMISPLNGEVVGWIHLYGLISPDKLVGEDAVLNGIAYDARGSRLFVTGKLWPNLFQIELVNYPPMNWLA